MNEPNAGVSDIDLPKLSPTGRETYEAVDSALRAEVGRRLPSTLDVDTVHRVTWIALETLAGQQDAWRRQHAGRELVDGLAETLDAAMHDCSDDGPCTAPGMQWWRQVAGRLVDPHGPLVAIAVERQMLVDDSGDLLADFVEPGDWLSTLDICFRRVRRHADEGSTAADLRRALAGLGAWVAGWVEHLDRAEPGEVGTP